MKARDGRRAEIARKIWSIKRPEDGASFTASCVGGALGGGPDSGQQYAADATRNKHRSNRDHGFSQLDHITTAPPVFAHDHVIGAIDQAQQRERDQKHVVDLSDEGNHVGDKIKWNDRIDDGRRE